MLRSIMLSNQDYIDISKIWEAVVAGSWLQAKYLMDQVISNSIRDSDHCGNKQYE